MLILTALFWCSKVDGTERLQLTFPRLFAFLPRWSPDVTQIAFMRRPSSRLLTVDQQRGLLSPREVDARRKRDFVNPLAGSGLGSQPVGGRRTNQLSQGGGGAGRFCAYQSVSLARCHRRVPSQTKSTAWPKRKETPIHSGRTSLIHPQKAAAEKSQAIRLIRR